MNSYNNFKSKFRKYLSLLTSDIATISGIMRASSTSKHKEQSEVYRVFIFSMNTGQFHSRYNQDVQCLNRQQILSLDFTKNLK